MSTGLDGYYGSKCGFSFCTYLYTNSKVAALGSDYRNQYLCYLTIQFLTKYSYSLNLEVYSQVSRYSRFNTQQRTM